MEDQEPQTPVGRVGPITSIITMIGLVVIIAFLFLCVFPEISNEQRPLCNNFPSKIHSDVPIYSTSDGVAVYGSFFLGIGSVDTYPAYYFYTGNPSDGYQRQLLNTRFVNVKVYPDSEYPHMIDATKYKMVYQSGVEVCTPVREIELHVPKNTLIKEVGGDPNG